LYGQKHIYSIPSSGKETTVTGLTLDDVKSFYTNYYSPSVSELVIVGDVSQDEIEPSLVFLENWQKKAVMMPTLPATPEIDETNIYLVDKTEAPQSEIRIGYLTDMKYDATGEYFKSYLMNFPLGGAFNSRINLNLREDKGWTYGARSYFNSADDPGPYIARAGVKASATDSSIVEFMAEIKNYSDNGISNDELAFMRKAVGQRDARSYETPGQKAGFLRSLVHYNLDGAYVDRQTEIINSIKKEEIDALAKKYLDYKKMNILVVGDEASNLPKLEKLGYPIVKLDEEGNNRIIRP
jgi:zinc protease